MNPRIVFRFSCSWSVGAGGTSQGRLLSQSGDMTWRALLPVTDLYTAIYYFTGSEFAGSRGGFFSAGSNF
jgi:hypothetical protein